MSEDQSIPTNEDYKDGFRKLYLPEWCLIPKEVKKDPNLSSNEKIFFGELNVLANERGYCWGTDEEFAELKGLGERTIQRYFSNMEIRGHITRETVTVPYKNDEGKLRWKKDRKIWMGKKELKKVADTTGLAVPTNPPNLAVSNEPAKSGGILIGKEVQRNNNKPPAVAAQAVVVFSVLNELKIPEALKIKISSEHDEEKVKLLVKRVKAWKGKGSDAIGCNTILKKWDTWEDNTPPEDRSNENKAWALENLKSYYETPGSNRINYRCEMLNKYVEFLTAEGVGQPKCFMYEQPDFKIQVKAFLEKNGITIQ